MAWGQGEEGSKVIGKYLLLKARGIWGIEGVSSMGGEVLIHGFLGAGDEVAGSMVLNISPSEVPGVGSGNAKDLSVDWGEFRPLVIRAIWIKGVVPCSVLDPEELPWGDVVGDCGSYSYSFGKGGRLGIGVGVRVIPVAG